ncbi:hypothetical protein FKM82_024816, partial [Ascaphus truei]
EHQPPYIIAVLPKYVEVRTFEPRLLVQSIELQRPRFITSAGPNIVYVASNHFVWRLVPVSIATQIQQLLQDKQFELALQLAQMKDDADGEKLQQIHHIQNLYAFNLFCQKRFDESMQVFSKLGTDPTHVIGMYPDLLPSDYKKQLLYPDPVPPLSGAELEKANLALIDYLTQVRWTISPLGGSLIRMGWRRESPVVATFKPGLHSQCRLLVTLGKSHDLQ